MRRLERNDPGGGRGFRIIEAGGRYLEPLTPPPPPRAPEPYKVVPPSSSLGRAHRRSSFVIIAETRPATPSSRGTSPTLIPTGRVSPFRGRGFKGPLPHAQSTPQSPENRQHSNGRRYGRYDRRDSVSQQNSPKRSLIPQPTRRRSVSLTKNNETKSSPKFGRRAAAAPVGRANGSHQANLGVGVTRTHSLKAPDLSPIQGTPTRPITETVGRYSKINGGNSHVAKFSPVKTRNTLTVPTRVVGNQKRRIGQERSPSRGLAKPTKRFVEEKKKRSNGDDDSRTKIPMRRGSLVNKNGSNLPTNRFIGKTVTKPGPRAVEADKNESTERETNSSGSENPRESSENPKNDEKTSEIDSPGTRLTDANSPTDTRKRETDLGLMDLLKQSSGATGTSSVVNTTTTTAVQPLQIEAAAILLEKDREIVNNKDSTTLPSPASLEPSPSSGLPSATLTSETSSVPKTLKTQTNNGNPSATSMSEKKNDNRDKEVTGSLTITQHVNGNTSQKNSSNGTTDETNNPGAAKKEPSNSTSTPQGTPRNKTLAGTTGNSRKNLLTRNGHQEGSRGEMRVSSGNPGSRVNNSIANNPQRNIGKEPTGSGQTESKVGPERIVASGGKSEAKPAEIVASVVAPEHRKTESRGSAIISSQDNAVPDGKRTVSRNVGETENVEATTNNSTVAANGDDKKFRPNNGSENSLKSSNGLSNVSVESTRSTDTGVSVNTVRGVSSAREKKGTHTMKRSEEIETLSGNVMHLERNGEPAVLDITELAEEEPRDTTRLGRFKNSLTRFGDRFSSMRCLGWRRNQKNQSWTGERTSQPRGTRGNAPSTTDANANPGNSRCNRMLTSWKNACRCTRLRECKCCRRAARVAPAESTTCCPPERRCGALCGRLFSRCKCNRSEAQHTRSIRAKHSLTSVAPPPITEEQREKIPEVLVEHNSVMRGAIPCLPVPIAWFCLVWNVLLPGSGTVWSGLFNLCVGQPRFSISAGPRARLGALIVNLIVGVGQFFTVLFCLVGWGWSIWWGVTMIRLARKYKRFRASEAASSDLEARGGEPTGLPPGVPSQALRGMERAR